MRTLQHVADVGMEPELAALAVIAAVDQDFPLRRLKEAAGEVHKGRFARAGLAHEGDGRPGGNFQRKVLQNVLAAVRIAEGHVLKFDVAVQRLPVFLLRMEGVAVDRLDLRRVAHLRLLVQKVGDALDGGLQGDKLRDV